MSTELDLGWLDPGLGALQRQESGMGSGLCRAIATRMGIDVVLVRVAFALLALSGGLGVALYAWGTALTRGASGVRPIHALLPSFDGWSPTAQKAAVILTSLAAVGLVSSVTPLPWGPGVILVALFVLARRGRPAGAWVRPSTAPAPTQAPAVATDEELVAQWRLRMTSVAGTARAPEPLPVVDLYSPEPAATRPSPPRPKAAWAIGVGILGVSAAAAAAGVLVLGSPMLGLGSALIAAGALTALYAAVARTRRVPRPLLVGLVVATIAAGWLAPRAAWPSDAPQPDAAVMTIRTVADERVIDLRTDDLAGIDEVRIEAIASDVTVLLPGPPLSVTTNELLSDVSVDTGNSTAAPLDFAVTVDATLSAVTLEERA